MDRGSDLSRRRLREVACYDEIEDESQPTPDPHRSLPASLDERSIVCHHRPGVRSANDEAEMVLEGEPTTLGAGL